MVDGELLVEGPGFWLWAHDVRVGEYIDFYDREGRLIASFRLDKYSLSFPTKLKGKEVVLDVRG
jgi:hypothetical protein